jgi:hypothetical protein
MHVKNKHKGFLYAIVLFGMMQLALTIASTRRQVYFNVSSILKEDDSDLFVNGSCPDYEQL